jgi:endonuclease/exonuclease/phosphatase family metal-dependent hydrolase
MQQILEFVPDRSAILAGDFNVRPDNPVIEQACDSGKFSAKLDGPPTVKSNRPTAKIDYIFVPANWELIEHKVIQTKLADHLPVLSTYRIPPVAETNSEIPG